MNDTQDTHGSTTRQGMLKSMEQPYRSLNRREVQQVEAGVLIVFFVVVLALGVAGVFLLDKVELTQRPHTVAVTNGVTNDVTPEMNR